jgi:hypothetical protein
MQCTKNEYKFNKERKYAQVRLRPIGSHGEVQTNITCLNKVGTTSMSLKLQSHRSDIGNIKLIGV